MIKYLPYLVFFLSGKLFTQDKLNSISTQIAYPSLQIIENADNHSSIRDEISFGLIINCKYKRQIFVFDNAGIELNGGLSIFSFQTDYPNLFFPGIFEAVKGINRSHSLQLIGGPSLFLNFTNITLGCGVDFSRQLINFQRTQYGKGAPSRDKKYEELPYNYRPYLQVSYNGVSMWNRHFSLEIIAGILPSNGTKLFITESFYKGIFVGPSISHRF